MRLPQDRIMHIDTELRDDKVDVTIQWQGELVRCKDCGLRGTPNCPVDALKDAQDYCAWAERKDT